MTDTRIIVQSRNLLDNESLFRNGFNFNYEYSHASELLEWIEKHTDIRFEWIPKSELVGASYSETAGLRIIKKGNHNV